MKAFLASLIGIVAIGVVAWLALGQLDYSSQHVNSSTLGTVRLD